MAERPPKAAGAPDTGASPGIGDPHAGREAHDPASFIGRKDRRASAVATQSGPPTDEETPEGHRDGQPASDDTAREAGQNR